MVLSRLREKVDRFVNSLALALAQVGVTPSTVTAIGLTASFLSLFFLLVGLELRTRVILATAAYSVSAFSDLLDGAVARASGRTSRRGAFLDSLSDRIEESVIMFGIALARIADAYVSLLFLVTSLMISYTRARAEALNVNLSGVGLMERPERVLLVISCMLLWLADPNLTFYALIAGCFLNVVTLAQRVLKVVQALEYAGR